MINPLAPITVPARYAARIRHHRDRLRLGGRSIYRLDVFLDFYVKLVRKHQQSLRGAQGIWQIIKSMFILRYIDDVELRMALENLLNRIELGNRFTRAIAVGNPVNLDRASVFPLHQPTEKTRIIT